MALKKVLPVLVSVIVGSQVFIIYSHNQLPPITNGLGCLVDKIQHQHVAFVTPKQQKAEQVAIRKHPLAGMIRSFPKGNHDATQRRVCLALTAVPSVIGGLKEKVMEVLNNARYNDTFDCVHLSIPERSMRFSDSQYPNTTDLQKTFDDPRFIIHRLFDYGPMTRYIAPMAFEQHPDTAIITFDTDVEMTSRERDLLPLIKASKEIDESAVWCNDGEDFTYNTTTKVVKPSWDTFEKHLTHDIVWNQAFTCRAVSGLLIKPKHFSYFWYNQSDYHESCFWDDDRWVSFQMGRQGFPMKAIDSSEQAMSRYENSAAQHRKLGSLTMVNQRMGSTRNCIGAWMEQHPEAYPEARRD